MCFTFMKKALAVTIFLFVFCFPNVFAASRYNEPGEDASKYVQMGHFYLREVRADRSMGTWENEDRWKIWYHFSVDVTNVEIKWHAIDGTNDHDRRDYTDKRKEREANKEYDIRHGNFPTYVDNMRIDVYYDYGGERHHYQCVIYTVGGADKGSQPLEVRVVDLAAGETADSTIPDESKDKDGDGALSSVKSPMDDILSMVKAPYNFLKWMADANTFFMLLFGFGMVYVSSVLLMKFDSAGAEIGALVTLMVGLIMLIGTILGGINALGF